MWKKAILNYYSVQKISDGELDEIVFEHFLYLIEQYEKDKHLIPVGNLVEISYEELKANSFNSIQKIYSELKLPSFELTADDLLDQIESEKNYTSFRHQFDSKTLKQIDTRWGKFIRQWNYNGI